MKDMRLSKHFMRSELTCRCCGRIGRWPARLKRLLSLLEKLRDYAGKPVHITSGYRCPSWNKQVGGVPNSYHSQGMAVDLVVKGMSVDALARAVERVGFTGIGRYLDARLFVHADIGPARKWTER